MADPLLTGALDRAGGWLHRSKSGHADEAIANLGRWFCGNALASMADPRPPGTGPFPDPAGRRRAAAYQGPSLDEILGRGLPGLRESAEELARASGFGSFAGDLPVVARDTWRTVLPSLIAAGAGDLAIVAVLIRASLFLGGPPDPLAVKAARTLAARQHPDGHFGSMAVTASCVWSLAESAVPGLTRAYPVREPLAEMQLRT